MSCQKVVLVSLRHLDAVYSSVKLLIKPREQALDNTMRVMITNSIYGASLPSLQRCATGFVALWPVA